MGVLGNQPESLTGALKLVSACNATWYWYERTGTSPRSRPVADGTAAKNCGADCHAAAPRDNVFVRAP